MPKSTAAVIEERIQKVSELLIQGKTRKEILQNASKLGWSKTSRQIDSYIRVATERIKRSVNRNIDIAIKDHLQKYDEVYRMAKEKENHNAMIMCLKETSKLYDIERARDNGTTVNNVVYLDRQDADL